ncbi:MAG: transglutaminase domain-containing protein [Acidobacteriota bacterium]
MRKLLACALLLVGATTVLGLGAQELPGAVIRSINTGLTAPVGLAWDGQKLWVADAHTAKLYSIDPSTGKTEFRLETPGYAPMGLTWDGRLLWMVDGADKTAYAVSPGKGETLKALPLDTPTPQGIAWDGKHLWVSDAGAGVITRIDSGDGTTYRNFSCPTAGGRRTEETGLAWDGTYLWIADRITNTIYQVDVRSGWIVNEFASPAPYPDGLAWDGSHLWCLDRETRKVYELNTRAGHSWVNRDAKHEKIVYTEDWRNFGPGVVKSLDVYIAVPESRPNQKILSEPEFSPKPAEFVTDRWGQKFARFHFRDLPSGGEAKAVMTVDAQVTRVRWFIDPAAVGTLKDIPEDIAEKYLADDSKLVLDDPVIQSAVREAVGSETNPYWIAQRINSYIQKKMHYELVGGWNPAPVVLARGSGSCSEYSFVMIAMCRAAGLPARYAGSVVIRGDDASTDDVFHRWVEVYLPHYGWFPVDPSGGDSPRPAVQAAYFGGLSNRFLITTVGGGSSRYLGWDYNSAANWVGKGKVKLMNRKAGEWFPVGKKYEPEVKGEYGSLTCKPAP